MQISDLLGAVSSGLARSNRWRVIVDFPTYAGTTTVEAQATLLARTTNTPASTVGVIEVPWGGRVLPLPGDRTYEEFPITFIGVNDMNVYNAFQSWSENINGSASNGGISALPTIFSDFTLQLMDTNDNITQTFVLNDGWPHQVGEMSMDSGEMDGFSTFTVSIRYINYTIPGVTK